MSEVIRRLVEAAKVCAELEREPWVYHTQISVKEDGVYCLVVGTESDGDILRLRAEARVSFHELELAKFSILAEEIKESAKRVSERIRPEVFVRSAEEAGWQKITALETESEAVWVSPDGQFKAHDKRLGRFQIAELRDWRPTT